VTAQPLLEPASETSVPATLLVLGGLLRPVACSLDSELESPCRGEYRSSRP
jgi:hypothetical protein